MQPRKWVPLLLLGAALLVTALLRVRIPLAAAEIPAGDKPVTNPMKGLVAWGENYRRDPYLGFAYVPVYWDELEPRQGEYDFAALEERCHFAQWRADGVRLILRLVTDTPTGERHMDIPQWLYDAMGGAGTWYDGDYGQGFSPDYTNETFRQAHQALIAALGQRYADGPQVAFVELGSLGHWGEWHVDTNAGIEPFPTQAITDGYVQDYLAAFSPEQLLLRRPYTIGRDRGLGLYNDSFGLPDSHGEWLSWIADGYTSDQNGEWLPAMPDFWRRAPSGGEFSPRQEDGWYFTAEQFPTTLDLLQQSHTTFLGPNAPAYGELTGTEGDNLRTLLAEMGYTLGVRRCTVWRTAFSRRMQAELTWENTGLAPLYADWSMALELRDKAGQTVWSGRAKVPFSDWSAGLHTVQVALPGDLPGGTYSLWVGIVDPLTDAPGVALQMRTVSDGALYRVAEIPLP